MKNKSMGWFQPPNLLLIFGMAVALLVSTSSSHMISASVEGGTPGPNTSNSNQSAAVAGPEEGHYIPPTNAEQSQGNQSAAEGCSPMDPRCNTDISCEEDPYKCVDPENAGQSQGGSQDLSPGSNTSNPNQGAAEGNPYDPHCITPTCNEQSQGGSQGTEPTSSSSGASSDSNQQAVDHINQAQSALQNGDTQGAQMHMDLAKQALGCSPMDPRGC
jgi:hypothetical protein